MRRLKIRRRRLDTKKRVKGGAMIMIKDFDKPDNSKINMLKDALTSIRISKPKGGMMPFIKL